MQTPSALSITIVLTSAVISCSVGLLLYTAFDRMGHLVISIARRLEPGQKHSNFFDELEKDSRYVARSLAKACILIMATLSTGLFMLASLKSGN